jgi:hypothetical protein
MENPMSCADITGQRLVAVFLLGCAILNFPILSMFNKAEDVFGIPSLCLTIFGAWAFLIGLMAFVIEQMRD